MIEFIFLSIDGCLFAILTRVRRRDANMTKFLHSSFRGDVGKTGKIIPVLLLTIFSTDISTFLHLLLSCFFFLCGNAKKSSIKRLIKILLIAIFSSGTFSSRCFFFNPPNSRQNCGAGQLRSFSAGLLLGCRAPFSRMNKRCLASTFPIRIWGTEVDNGSSIFFVTSC
jgi:hypothetical protein